MNGWNNDPLKRETKPRGFRIALTLLICVAIVVSIVVLSNGMSGSQKRPRISLVSKGMTVEQVERVLGKPIEVIDMPPVVPDTQIRHYKGDDDHSNFIHFKKGVAEDIHDSIPRKNWFPVS